MADRSVFHLPLVQFFTFGLRRGFGGGIGTYVAAIRGVDIGSRKLPVNPDR